MFLQDFGLGASNFIYFIAYSVVIKHLWISFITLWFPVPWDWDGDPKGPCLCIILVLYFCFIVLFWLFILVLLFLSTADSYMLNKDIFLLITRELIKDIQLLTLLVFFVEKPVFLEI